MRRLTLTCVACLLAATASAGVSNPGFETGDLSGWEAWGFVHGVHEGDGFEGTHTAVLGLDAAEQGFQQSGMYADAAAVPGQVGYARVAASLPDTDALTGTGIVTLALELYSTTDSTIADYVQVEVTPGAHGTWTETTTSLTVGEGFDLVRVVVLVTSEGGTTGGSVWVDDVDFVVVEADENPGEEFGGEPEDTDVPGDTDVPSDTDSVDLTDDTDDDKDGGGCATSGGLPLWGGAVWLAVAALRRRTTYRA